MLTADSGTALLFVATKKTTIPLLQLDHKKWMAFPAESLEVCSPCSCVRGATSAMSCVVPPGSVILYLKPMNGTLAVCVPFWNVMAPSPVATTSLLEPSLAATLAMPLLNAML